MGALPSQSLRGGRSAPRRLSLRRGCYGTPAPTPAGGRASLPAAAELPGRTRSRLLIGVGDLSLSRSGKPTRWGWAGLPSGAGPRGPERTPSSPGPAAAALPSLPPALLPLSPLRSRGVAPPELFLFPNCTVTTRSGFWSVPAQSQHRSRPSPPPGAERESPGPGCPGRSGDFLQSAPFLPTHGERNTFARACGREEVAGGSLGGCGGWGAPAKLLERLGMQLGRRVQGGSSVPASPLQRRLRAPRGPKRVRSPPPHPDTQVRA